MHTDKVLVIKFRLKKEAREMWKQGWAIREEHKETVQHCRDGVRKAKAHLMQDVKGSKKGLCKYLGSKRKTRENTDLFLNGGEVLWTKDTEKAEVSMLSSP